MDKYNITKKYFTYFTIIIFVAVIALVMIENNAGNKPANNSDVWIGVETVALNASIIKQYSIQANNGLLVTRTFMGSPAEIAGIKKGDIIRRWNGISITDQNRFQSLIIHSVPGDKITLTLDRSGDPVMAYVEIGLRPGTF